MSIEIRHLRQFVVVAEELHFTRAAARLHIAQPALSAQIKKLEAELEIVLFTRNTRVVRLTAEGEEFFALASAAVEKYDDALALASSLRSGRAGRVTLGVNPRLGSAYKREIQRLVFEANPDVTIDFVAAVSSRLVEEVVGSRIDAALGLAPVHDLQARYQLVREDQALVALPEGHPLAERDLLELTDLRTESWILPSTRIFEWGAMMHQHCRNAGFEMRVSDAVADYDEDFTGVVDGRGIEVVPEIFVGTRGIDGVVFVPLKDFSMPLAMFRRADNTNPALSVVYRALFGPAKSPKRPGALFPVEPRKSPAAAG